MWDLIVSVPDHCLSFYSGNKRVNLNTGHVSLTMLKIDRTIKMLFRNYIQLYYCLSHNRS